MLDVWIAYLSVPGPRRRYSIGVAGDIFGSQIVQPDRDDGCILTISKQIQARIVLIAPLKPWEARLAVTYGWVQRKGSANEAETCCGSESQGCSFGSRALEGSVPRRLPPLSLNLSWGIVPELILSFSERPSDLEKRRIGLSPSSCRSLCDVSLAVLLISTTSWCRQERSVMTTAGIAR